MEQFIAILILTERTFQNGVSRNAGCLINVMAENVKLINHRKDTLDLTTWVKNIKINIQTLEFLNFI